MSVQSLTLLRVGIIIALACMLGYMIAPKWACVQISPPAHLFTMRAAHGGDTWQEVVVRQNKSMLAFLGYMQQVDCDENDLCNSPFTYCRQLLSERCWERAGSVKQVAPFDRFISTVTGCLLPYYANMTLAIKLGIVTLMMQLALLTFVQYCSNGDKPGGVRQVPGHLLMIVTTVSGIALGILMIYFVLKMPIILNVVCDEQAKVNGLCPMPPPNSNRASLVENPWEGVGSAGLILICLTLFHLYYTTYKQFKRLRRAHRTYDFTRVNTGIQFERFTKKETPDNAIGNSKASLQPAPVQPGDSINQVQMNATTINLDNDDFVDVDLDAESDYEMSYTHSTTSGTSGTSLAHITTNAQQTQSLDTATEPMSTAHWTESNSETPVLMNQQLTDLIRVPILRTANSQSSMVTLSSDKPDGTAGGRRSVTFADEHLGGHLEQQMSETTTATEATLATAESQETFVTAQSDISSTRQAVIKKRDEPLL